MHRGKIVEEEGNGTLELFDLPTDTETLERLLTDVYANYWDRIHFGTCVQGGVWEVKAPNAPQKISLFDGYLTVDFGAWHFHICIGQNEGTRGNPTSDTLAARRRTATAQLYRGLRADRRPGSWGLRLFNGAGEQQMTVFLPNPYLSFDQKVLKTPNFSHLELWDHLRQTYLNLPSDPLDREPSRQVCG
ncbi:MAG: hypothetical protein AAF552_05245 [Pseudomonadota bacterium]